MTLYDRRHLVVVRLGADGAMTDFDGQIVAKYDVGTGELSIDGKSLAIHDCEHITGERAWSVKPAGMSAFDVQLSTTNDVMSGGEKVGTVDGFKGDSASLDAAGVLFCAMLIATPPRADLSLVDDAHRARGRIAVDDSIVDGSGQLLGSYDRVNHTLTIAQQTMPELDAMALTAEDELEIRCEPTTPWHAKLGRDHRVNVGTLSLGTVENMDTTRGEMRRLGALLCALQRQTHGQL
jgi:hypothetical protein